MAFIRYTWTKYTFTPAVITEDIFLLYKGTLRKNPDYKFGVFDFKSFFKRFGLELLVMILLGAVIGVIISVFEKEPDWWENISNAMGMLAIIWFFFGGIQSMISYVTYIIHQDRYYSKLKNDLNKSKDFTTFHELRRFG